MRQSRIDHYAAFTVYPLLMAVMVLVIAGDTGPVAWMLALGFALGGGFLWSLLEHLLLRSLLQGCARIAVTHDRIGIQDDSRDVTGSSAPAVAVGSSSGGTFVQWRRHDPRELIALLHH
jgi:hypothetical protein